MELEMKFRCEDIEAIKVRALKSGFVSAKEKDQSDTYFVVNKRLPDGSWWYLRVRENHAGGSCSIDSCRVLSKIETDEVECSVASAEQAIRLLESLGFKQVCVVEKQRSDYVKGALTLSFDAVKGLGSFVEIEILGEPSVENKRLLEEVRDGLGLDVKDIVDDRGYPDLLLGLKRQNVSPSTTPF